jgi:hypothetical protein
LSGGCDDPNGNVYSEEDEMFLCSSVSSSFYLFDPATGAFANLTDMPRARHRHTAVAINNQVWIVGGRTVEDELLADVDVSAQN